MNSRGDSESPWKVVFLIGTVARLRPPHSRFVVHFFIPSSSTSWPALTCLPSLKKVSMSGELSCMFPDNQSSLWQVYFSVVCNPPISLYPVSDDHWFICILLYIFFAPLLSDCTLPATFEELSLLWESNTFAYVRVILNLTGCPSTTPPLWWLFTNAWNLQLFHFYIIRKRKVLAFRYCLLQNN